jgi:hypothetical protein
MLSSVMASLRNALASAEPPRSRKEARVASPPALRAELRFRKSAVVARSMSRKSSGLSASERPRSSCTSSSSLVKPVVTGADETEVVAVRREARRIVVIRSILAFLCRLSCAVFVLRRPHLNRE